MYIVFLTLIVLALIGFVWWQARPSEEERFIQTARTDQLTRYLRQRGHTASR